MAEHDEIAYRRAQADAFLGLARIGRALERQTEALFASERLEGITYAQSNALVVLFQARAAVNARYMADQLGVSDVTVGRFVRALVKGGWVRRTRDPDDSRSWLLQPTDMAYQRLPDFIGVFNQVLDRAVAGLDRDDVRTLVRGVERIGRNLDV